MDYTRFLEANLVSRANGAQSGVVRLPAPPPPPTPQPEVPLMNSRFLTAVLVCAAAVHGAELTPPKAGKTEILPLKDLKPGMQATAWTVFSGMTPEAVPVEI